MPTSTPWGPSQASKQYARGIMWYSTASHGGFRVSPTLLKKMPECLRKESGWYEEDCEWSLVCLAFPHVFSESDRKTAISSAKNHYPDQYTAFTGEQIPVEESCKLRERAFEEATKDKWVVVSACLSWNVGEPRKGMSLCYATLGGKRTADAYKADRRFLIPHEVYDTRGNQSFVVEDPDQFEEVPDYAFY